MTALQAGMTAIGARLQVVEQQAATRAMVQRMLAQFMAAGRNGGGGGGGGGGGANDAERERGHDYRRHIERGNFLRWLILSGGHTSGVPWHVTGGDRVSRLYDILTPLQVEVDQRVADSILRCRACALLNFVFARSVALAASASLESC